MGMATNGGETGVPPVAIVTGAGSGIGRAVCERLDTAGTSVVLVGRTMETLRATGAMLSSPWLAVQADVCEAEQFARVVESALENFGRIDVLINNAGWATMAPIERHTPELLNRIFAVNAVAPAAAIAAVWASMVSQRSGRIVNVSSMATMDPFPGFFGYAAAKAAVNLMALSASNEGRAHGIRAFAVAPGAVETAMLRSIVSTQTIPPARALTPESVARVIVECALGNRDGESGRVILLPSP